MLPRWIKVNETLPTSPATVGLAVYLDTTPEEALGHLVKVLLWGDLHVAEDGECPGGVPLLSRLFGDRIPGGLREIGWITIDGDAVRFVDWSRHNGQSAKTRATTSRKKARQRGASRDVPGMSPRGGDKCPPSPGDKCPPRPATAAGQDGGQQRDARGDQREERREEEELISRARGVPQEGGTETGHSGGQPAPVRLSDVRGPDVEEHMADADRVFRVLPGRVVEAGPTKFRRAFAFARMCGQSRDAIHTLLVSYYASPIGRTKFCRAPHNLLADEAWNDPPEAWDTDRGEKSTGPDAGEVAADRTRRLLDEQRAYDERVKAERRAAAGGGA